MIEVLVASTLLTIIVMMLAMLFQQSSVAWRIGLMRAQGFMKLRSYIGAIQRDAAAAIDAKNIPNALLCRNQEQKFTASEISFYTLTGVDTNRSLKYVTITRDGTRQQSRLVLGGSSWTWRDDKETSLLDFLSSSSDDNLAIDPQGFSFKWASGTERNNQGKVVSDQNRLPVYLTVAAKMTQEGLLYEIGAESAGPDGIWNTDDDIRTWKK